MSTARHPALVCSASCRLGEQVFQLRRLRPHVARVRTGRQTATLQRLRSHRPQAFTPQIRLCLSILFAHSARLPYSFCSVHTCPNTPCFRCRLPGHRAKDCNSRRWPKDMCWRCLRSDRFKPILRDGLHPPTHISVQPLTVAVQSRSSAFALRSVQRHRVP